MLLRIRDQEVHELDVCTCSCRGSTPGLPGLVTVVHRVDDDIVAEPKVQLGDRTRRPVGSDPDHPASRQTAGEHRVLDRVDGQVDRPCARSDDLGDARLPDSRETGEHGQASPRWKQEICLGGLLHPDREGRADRGLRHLRAEPGILRLPRPPAARFYDDLDGAAATCVKILRAQAGATPHDKQLSQLVGELTTRSEDFSARWAAHDVGVHRAGTKILHHHEVGEPTLGFKELALDSAPSIALSAYIAEPTAPTAERLQLPAVWNAADATELRRIWRQHGHWRHQCRDIVSKPTEILHRQPIHGPVTRPQWVSSGRASRQADR